jgi:hypothetical protein
MTLEEVLPNLMDGFEGFKTSMEKITADAADMERELELKVELKVLLSGCNLMIKYNR